MLRPVGLYIYLSGTRRELIGDITLALPDMDEDMRELAHGTVAKLEAMNSTAPITGPSSTAPIHVPMESSHSGSFSTDANSFPR